MLIWIALYRHPTVFIYIYMHIYIYIYTYINEQCHHLMRWWFFACHDDVIKWKHFLRYWPFVRGIHWSPVNSPHKGQWRVALMFSLICARINAWVNNREAGDLRRYWAHYDVTVMGPMPLSEPFAGLLSIWLSGTRKCMYLVGIIPNLSLLVASEVITVWKFSLPEWSVLVKIHCYYKLDLHICVLQ